MVGDDRRFKASGLLREHWKNADPIRKIFKQAFLNANLPYYNPHCFRNTLSVLGQKVCQSPEEYKAWSQNLGHEGVLTTFYSYGEVQDYRQAELLKKLREPKGKLSPEKQTMLDAMVKQLRESL